MATQAEKLIALAMDAELFQDQDCCPYASIEVANHIENWKVRSPDFQRWLRGAYFHAFNGAPNKNAFEQALNQIEAHAVHGGLRRKVFMRVGYDGEDIYLDLCDPDWTVVRISEGGWEVCDLSPVYFRRTRGMRPLPTPTRGGCIAELRQFVNLKDCDFPLFLTWLAFTLLPKGPYPILALHGEQGTAKTTTARIARELIDPAKLPVRSEPRDERDLAIAANNGRVLAFDNLSKVDTRLSDAMCRASTGGGIGTRRLYTDDEETLLDIECPIIVNGIGDLLTRGDALDRAILFDLPRISDANRHTEAEHSKSFALKKPAFLGALLDIVVIGLRERDAARARLTSLPRMADFAVFGSAVEQAVGLPRGGFNDAYEGNLQRTNEIALDASPVARAISEIIRDGAFDGSRSELFARLNLQTSDDQKRSLAWPKSEDALSRALTRISPNLRRAGIQIERYRAGDAYGSRRLRIFPLNPSNRNSDEPIAVDQLAPFLVTGELPTLNGHASAENDPWAVARQVGLEFAEPD